MQKPSNLGKNGTVCVSRMKLSYLNLPKIIEGHTKPSKDFQSITRTLPKISEDPRTLSKISEDHLNTSEDL